MAFSFGGSGFGAASGGTSFAQAQAGPDLEEIQTEVGVLHLSHLRVWTNFDL